MGLREREFHALDQAYTGRLWTLPTVDYVDGDSLALGQARDPGAVQRRSVHKDILAAPIGGDEAKPLPSVGQIRLVRAMR